MLAEPGTPTSYRLPFALMTVLFFLWGFVTVMNDLLMPHLQEVFHLNNTLSALVQFAFFIAYGIVSFSYYLLSITTGDPIRRIGYRNGIIIALIISGVGCLLFYVAASALLYGWFLAALFVLASGITVLQISANPYVALLGQPDGAAGRLNLSQGFNSLGTALAPLVGGYLIFKDTAIGVDVLKLPYLSLAGVFILLALIFRFTRLPEIKGEEILGGAWRFRHLRLGMIAIFVYVGAEVTLGSYAIKFMALPEVAGLTNAQAKAYLVYYWGGAMTGRFLGTLALYPFSSLSKRVLAMAGTAVGLTAFLLLITGKTVEEAIPYLALLVVNGVGFLLGRGNASRMLVLFSGAALLLVSAASFGQHTFALWALLAIGLFNSVMWSNIFTLSIRGLGTATSQGSSLLIMMIIGGAFIPVLAGALADVSAIGLQRCFLVLIPCYLYLVYFGWTSWRDGKTVNSVSDRSTPQPISH